MKTNYSNETSRPPLNEIIMNGKRQRQCDKVFQAIRSGANCLKQLETQTGIPQAICSARCNDLIKESRIIYNGFVHFENRKRKRISILTGQLTLFKIETFGCPLKLDEKFN